MISLPGRGVGGGLTQMEAVVISVVALAQAGASKREMRAGHRGGALDKRIGKETSKRFDAHVAWASELNTP